MEFRYLRSNLKLSTKATISMPWHRVQDELEEDRLAKSGSAFGSTRRGIAYAYSDKYRKKTIRLGDLLHLDDEAMQARLKTILESKNLELAGCYHQEPMSYSALAYPGVKKQAQLFAPYICDTGQLSGTGTAQHGKKVVLEAQLGAMRDIDYGIFPYTSSSSTISAYGPIGAGIPGAPIRSCGWRFESLFHLRRCRTVCRRRCHVRLLDESTQGLWRRIWCSYRTSAPCRTF